MTIQIGEILKYKETEYFLKDFLLESYFDEFPDKKPKGEIESCMWRGYFADYEIKKDELFVWKFHVSIKGHYKSVINQVFPNSKKMYWFSGLILLNLNSYPKSNPKKTEDKNEYLIFQVKNGSVLESRNYNLEELILFKKEQTEYFKMTLDYETLKEKYKEKLLKNYESEKLKLTKKERKRYEYNHANFNQYVEMFIIEHSKEFLAD